MRLLVKLIIVAIVATFTNVIDASAQTQKVWTIKEILDARKEPVTITNPRMCNGTLFKPCICAADVSALVQYRPSIAQCGRNAGIVLSGKYTRVFSVVVRDRANRDRYPTVPDANGRILNCTLEQAKQGLPQCSVFKVQKILKASHPNGDAEVHCLGASGYSRLFKNVTRITAKLADVPGSHNDPLERLCLSGPTKPLN